MTHAAPEWVNGLGEGGILILDDYTRADSRFMQAAMEIIDRQEYISGKLPKDWHVILTSNPDSGDYHVSSLDPAQKTRFVTVILKFDADCWARWAEENDIDGRCINFLLMHPELVSQTTNARSITTFFNCISSIPDFENNLPLIQMIGEGSVGGEFSTMFTTFINNRLDKLISPETVITNESDSYVMGALRDCIGREGASGLPVVPLCIAYRKGEQTYSELPLGPNHLSDYTPIYEELPGWQEDLRAVRRWENLPAAARAYILRIEDMTGVRVRLVSVGPQREQVIEIP